MPEWIRTLSPAAARALRFYPAPAPDFAPFVLRALKTMAGRDEPVSFAAFGDYAVADGGTSALRELVETIAWLARPRASYFPRPPELAARPGAFSKTVLAQLHRALAAVEKNHSEKNDSENSDSEKSDSDKKRLRKSDSDKSDSEGSDSERHDSGECCPLPAEFAGPSRG